MKTMAKIEPNDIVLHKPSGEKWVVAGVNAAEGLLIPKGWPFPTIAKISDCEVIEKSRPEFAFQDPDVIAELLKRGLRGFINI